MRQWYNPTPSLCSRAADLKYNGENFIQYPDCCISCDPEPQQSRDLAMVQTWVLHFDEVNKKKQSCIKPLRSDGTYHPLEKNMKDSLLQMLQHWRGQKWATIRGSQRGIPSTMFLPQHIILRIVERAHVCSDLDRLCVICKGWNRFTEYGAELLQYLGKIMMGFNELFEERGIEDNDNKDLEMASVKQEDHLEKSVTNGTRSHVRLVLRSDPNITTPSVTSLK